jgi:organic radical activating enzyme
MVKEKAASTVGEDGLRPHTMTIVLGYRCNIRCAHCCFSSGPARADSADFLARIGASEEGPDHGFPALDLDAVAPTIEAAAALGSLRTVVFSGGEPVLFFDVLRAGLATARRCGLTTTIVTNSTWAKTPAAAARVLDKLVAAGLDQVALSYSDYHAEFVPLAWLKTALDESLAHGLRVALVVAERPEGGVTARGLLEALVVDSSLVGDRVLVMGGPVIATGRGRSLPEADVIAPTPVDAHAGCPNIGRYPSVTPDGKLFACTGAPHRDIPELEVGRLADAPAAALLERLSSNVLYRWLATRGPQGILDEVAPGRGRPASTLCEACRSLFLDADSRRALAAYMEAHAPEAIEAGQIRPVVELGRRLRLPVLSTAAR